MNTIMATMTTVIQKKVGESTVWYSIHRLVFSEDEFGRLVDQGKEYQFILYVKEGEAPYILIGNPIMDGLKPKVYYSMMDALEGVEEHFSQNYSTNA